MVQNTETGFANRVQQEFTTHAWVLIPMGIAISLIGAYIVNAVRVPFLYMDSLGVVIIAVLIGPWAAAVTGLFVNIAQGFIINPTFWFYTPLQIAFGIAAGYMAIYGWFRYFWKVIVVGLVIALISIVMGAPITVLAFGGVTGTGSDAVTAFFAAAGGNIWEAVIGQTIVVEPIDKVLTAVIAALIVNQIPERYRPTLAAKVLDKGMFGEDEDEEMN